MHHLLKFSYSCQLDNITTNDYINQIIPPKASNVSMIGNKAAVVTQQ